MFAKWKGKRTLAVGPRDHIRTVLFGLTPTAVFILALAFLVVPARADLFDDFEDGDWTANPTWVDSNPGYGWDGGVVADPVRPDNLVWKAMGTPSGANRAIATTDFAPMSWMGFHASVEFYCDEGSYSATLSVADTTLEEWRTGLGEGFQVCFSGNPAGLYRLKIGELSASGWTHHTQEWDSAGAPPDEWRRANLWHDTESGLIRANVERLSDGHIYVETSIVPTSFGDGPLSFVDLGAAGGGVYWNYLDNPTVSITDTGNQPPIISCNSPVVLWSPDHELVDVSSAFSVTDPDGDDVTLSVRVISDESETPETGDGTGRHAPDFKDELLEGGRGLLVRSERRGPENGRFYIVVVEADDGNGGVSTAACIAAVCPHDQDEDSLADVLAQAAAGAAAVQDAPDALPPPGLYEHGLSGELGPKQ